MRALIHQSAEAMEVSSSSDGYCQSNAVREQGRTNCNAASHAPMPSVRMELNLDNKGSTPLSLIVPALIMGLTSPFVAWLFIWMALHSYSETQDIWNAAPFAVFAALWLAAWTFAMAVAALNPLFGKTAVSIDRERIEIKKCLFRICWKNVKFENDRDTFLTLMHCTEQYPAQSSSLIEKGVPDRTVYKVSARRGKCRVIIHESHDEGKENAILNRIQCAIRLTQEPLP